MKELIFLTLANNLPRIRFLDKIRFRILRMAGIIFDGKSKVWGPLTIRPIGRCNNLRIGSGTFINTEVRFGVVGKISIGNNVLIGPRVMFETVSHGLKYIPGKGRGVSSKPIVVGDEVWIGAAAVITQGVTIGEGAVVAAGALVNRDVEPRTLVAGVPAKLIKYIE